MQLDSNVDDFWGIFASSDVIWTLLKKSDTPGKGHRNFVSDFRVNSTRGTTRNGDEVERSETCLRLNSGSLAALRWCDRLLILVSAADIDGTEDNGENNGFL